MINGLTGTKIGMTRYFTDNGHAIPVTIIKIEPHKVVRVKTLKKDGYCALQVTCGKKKIGHITKPELGHFMKSEIDVGNGLWEFRYDNNNDDYDNNNDCDKGWINIGEDITISLFSTMKKVDITGISKGKGFSGTVKRWNFCSQDASHGNSLSHRAPGSIGQNQTPGKVFKGKKMAGQMGNVRVTVQNLDVVFVDVEKNLLFIKGSVPGVINSVVYVKASVKYY